ncbi:MAG: hypothetical protein R2755_33540 [Acidimicrobiales bacterium]
MAEEYGEVEERLADATALLKEAEQAAPTPRRSSHRPTPDAWPSPRVTPSQTSKLATMLQGFVAAVVATFLAGIAFFFVADSRRRQATPARPAAKPAAGANPPVPAAAPVAAAVAETPARATASSPAPVQAQAATLVTGSSPAPAAAKPAAAKPMTSSKPVASTSGTALHGRGGEGRACAPYRGGRHHGGAPHRRGCTRGEAGGDHHVGGHPGPPRAAGTIAAPGRPGQRRQG